MRNNARAANSIALLAMTSITRADRTMISIKARDRISHECNTVQDQDDKKFTFDKINEHSVKIKVADAASRTVSELQEFCIASVKVDLQELIIKKTTIV